MTKSIQLAAGLLALAVNIHNMNLPSHILDDACNLSKTKEEYVPNRVCSTRFRRP